MKSSSRRNFLKAAGIISAGVAAAGTERAVAKPTNILSEDRDGVLVDTTVCIGCRNCELACQQAHMLPTKNQEYYKDHSVFKKFRRPDSGNLTVINEFNNPHNELLPYNVKYQCMHCDKPACVSACIVGALTKQENGSVIWDSGKCIGCRYCMVACQFQVPSFDYDKPIQPNIHKCDFCNERKKHGELPACVDACPVEALLFGQRSELIRIARNRIKRKPDNYVSQIYGEKEVGGTSWLYLAGVEFEELQFPKLSEKPAPGVSESIQHGIFAYFIPPAALYSWLGAMMWVTKRRSELSEGESYEQ